MVDIDRIRVTYTGWSGGPGVSTFYATDAAALVPQLRIFFNHLADCFPAAVTIGCELTGDTINDESGLLTGGWAGGVFANVQGTDQFKFASPVGACVTWISDGVPWGYRVKGRTFLVPLAAVAFAEDGTLDNTKRGNMAGAAAELVTSATGNMKIWNRPRELEVREPPLEDITQRDGTSWDVISSTVRDSPAVLRSRRG